MNTAKSEPILYRVLERAAPCVFWRGKYWQVGDFVPISPCNDAEERKLARYMAAGFLHVATKAEKEAAGFALACFSSVTPNVELSASLSKHNAHRSIGANLPTGDSRNHTENQAPDGESLMRCSRIRLNKLQGEVRRLQKFLRAKHVSRTTFGETLERLRKMRGFTSQQLAERCGCGLYLIVRLEAGEIVSPQLRTIEKLAAGLHMKASELIAAYEKHSDLAQGEEKTVE